MQKGWNRHLHWLLSELPSTPANVDLAPVASRVALVGIGGMRYEFSSVEIVVVKLRRSRAFGHLTYSF